MKKKIKRKETVNIKIISDVSLSNGMSYYVCRYPFCKRKLEIRKWNYSSQGKKCECGAILRNGKAFFK